LWRVDSGVTIFDDCDLKELQDFKISFVASCSTPSVKICFY